MEKEYLERMIEEGNSLNKIAKESGRGLTIVRYWVRKYGLKSKYSPYNENSIKEYGTHRICPKCKRMVETENFNDRRGKKNSSVYCKTCTTIQTVDRVRKMKELMVEYKGGCCQKCGYDKYLGALEFHHLDPNEKDFNPSHYRKYTFDERVKNELDKCILLCSNCHRETHFEINERKRELR
jgi:hypothetical protein